MEAECGEAALVFCCSVVITTSQWLNHPFISSQFFRSEVLAHGVTGFSAKNLPRIKVRPRCRLEARILLQAESRIQFSVVVGLRPPSPCWLSAGAAFCSQGLPPSLPHGSPCLQTSSGESPFHQTPFMLPISLSRKSPVPFED